MRLPARQQRALDAIEIALEARDPRLAAMFTMFARLTRGEEPTGTERLPRRGKKRLRGSGKSGKSRKRWRHALLPFVPAAALLAVLMGLAVAGLTSGASACSTPYVRGIGFAPAARPVADCMGRQSPPAVPHSQNRPARPDRYMITFPGMPK